MAATGRLTTNDAPLFGPALYCTNRPSMQSHELLYNGEPETEATVLPGKGRVRLAEAIKNVRQKCRFNTQSRILYRQFRQDATRSTVMSM